MNDARRLLEEYVRNGQLMQVATLSPSGGPNVCNVWYSCGFGPDTLNFISKEQRQHCENIRRDGRVAGSIVAIDLTGLGQVTRGVTFVGTARELPTIGTEDRVRAFLTRWPAASSAIDPGLLARGEAHSRLYEIAVREWVLFDEANFPQDPRQVVPADGGVE
ncbi:pyridoxamine 5'-phosphate oxidase [Krasilnikovia cinnamomea]|uniref:Pyridoxamine 5'-phosphate oxidase n=1 Tax=Krasilnikovia cinnamomea TaxID=349313 RepID=A0A4Q7ZGA7_9ACTN|nr:pyridoxamine 5'-phosphate oxidase family protein [Krasilnikovia cinnamomea]RZU49059.1 pyridoxamine 5'-phosphate oxidase [Krasilnikovia cinnamomea]